MMVNCQNVFCFLLAAFLRLSQNLRVGFLQFDRDSRVFDALGNRELCEDDAELCWLCSSRLTHLGHVCACMRLLRLPFLGCFPGKPRESHIIGGLWKSPGKRSNWFAATLSSQSLSLVPLSLSLSRFVWLSRTWGVSTTPLDLR